VHGGVDAMQSPHCQQSRHAAAEHPHHVLREQAFGDVVDVRHGEQRQVRHFEAPLLRGLGEVVQSGPVVAHRGGQQTYPGGAARRAGKVNGVVR
jgi:hypothetical protein